MLEKLKALESDQNLKQLAQKLRGFNPFRVLKAEHYEIRHSNVLAWLLDASGSHGLNETFLLAFIELLTKEGILSSSLVATSCRVFRERLHVDLLLVFDDLVIIIENKYHTSQGREQLANYYHEVQEQFRKTTIGVFLTLNEEAPNDELHYKRLSYDKLVETFKRTLSTLQEGPVREFIEYYIESVSPNLSTSSEKALATQLLNQHRDALDFIYKVAKKEVFREAAQQFFSDEFKSVAKEGKSNFETIWYLPSNSAEWVQKHGLDMVADNWGPSKYPYALWFSQESKGGQLYLVLKFELGYFSNRETHNAAKSALSNLGLRAVRAHYLEEAPILDWEPSILVELMQQLHKRGLRRFRQWEENQQDFWKSRPEYIP